MTPLDAVAAAIRERLLDGKPAPLPGLGTLVRQHVAARVEERADGARVLLPPGDTIGLAETEPGHESLALAFARFRHANPDRAQVDYTRAMDQIEGRLAATGEVRLPGVGLLRRTSSGVVLGVEADLLAAVNRTYDGLPPVGADATPSPTPHGRGPQGGESDHPASQEASSEAPIESDEEKPIFMTSPPSSPAGSLPWESATEDSPPSSTEDSLSLDEDSAGVPVEPVEDVEAVFDTPMPPSIPEADPFGDEDPTGTEFQSDSSLDVEGDGSDADEPATGEEARTDHFRVDGSAHDPFGDEDLPGGEADIDAPRADDPELHEAEHSAPTVEERESDDVQPEAATALPHAETPAPDEEAPRASPTDSPDESGDEHLSPSDGAFLDDEALDGAFDDVLQAPFGTTDAPPLSDLLPPTPPQADPSVETDRWEDSTWTTPLRATSGAEPTLAAGDPIEDAEFTVVSPTGPEAEMGAALVDLGTENAPSIVVPADAPVATDASTVETDPQRRGLGWLWLLLVLALLAAAAAYFWPEIRATFSPDPTEQQTASATNGRVSASPATLATVDAGSTDPPDSSASPVVAGAELDGGESAASTTAGPTESAGGTSPDLSDASADQPSPSRSDAARRDPVVNMAPPVITGLSREEASALSSRQPVERGADAWTLVIQSTRSLADAQATQTRYARAGYRTSVLTVTAGDQPQHRVAVGQFTSKADAIRLRDRLPPQAPADTWPLDLQTL